MSQKGVTARPKAYVETVRKKLPYQLVLVATVPSQKNPRVRSSGCASQWKLGSNVEGRQTTSRLMMLKSIAKAYIGYTDQKQQSVRHTLYPKEI